MAAKVENQTSPKNNPIDSALKEALDHTTNAHQQGQPQGQPQPNTQGQPQPQGQPQFGNQNVRHTFMDLNGIFHRPMARRSTGEVTSQYKKKLDELMVNHIREGYDRSFRLHVMDNGAGNIGPMSLILVAYYVTKGTQRYASVYTLIVEGSTDILPTKTFPINGRNVQIETVASDIFTAPLWSKVVSFLETSHGQNTLTEIYDAGVTVLPRELSWEDEHHMRQVAFISTQAAYATMERFVSSPETRYFDLSLVNTSETSLSAKLSYNANSEFNSTQTETATGLPVRSDLRVSLIGSLNQSAQEAEFGFEQSRELISVDGYVDLSFENPAQVPGQMPVTQHYVPTFVITRADTQIDAVTMELQLLALAQTTLVSQNVAWAGVFRPNHDVTGLDLRDIGAIGYEVNLSGEPNTKPQKVDTKSKEFDINALYNFITMNLHKDIVYAMDVVEGGDLSWLQEHFLESTYASPYYDQMHPSKQLVIQAANNLTNDYFDQYFDRNHPIAFDMNNRIHLGYYKDSEGRLRDIRDIDYLAMLNISGKDDLSVVARWGETFDNTGIPIEIRLEDRLNILKGVLGSNFSLKGYARRIVLNPMFISALSDACIAAGLVIRPHNTIQEFSGGMARGQYNFSQFAVPNAMAGGLFKTASNNYRGGGIGAYQGAFSRR